MKKTIFTITLLTTSFLAFGQKNKVVNAYNAIKKGEFDKAIENIDAAIEHEKTKDDAKTWKYRGDAFLGAATSENKAHKTIVEDPILEAFKSYFKAIELDEADRYKQEIMMNMIAVVHPLALNEGVDKFQAQKYESAMEHFGISAFIKSMMGQVDTLATYNAALAAERAGKVDEALQIYQEVAKTGYLDGDVYSLIANIHKQKEQPEEMLNAIKEGREKHPDNQGLIIDELNYYLISEQHDKAIESLDLAISKDPKNTALYFALGNAYEGIGNRDKAEETYLKSLEIDENYFDATYNLGALYFNHAVEHLDKIQEIKDVKKYKAEKVFADELFQKALPFLERAHQINPEDRNTMASLVELYARTNQTEKWQEVRAKLKGE
jgi:tetratricopeptide (TPR) repeat protein